MAKHYNLNRLQYEREDYSSSEFEQEDDDDDEYDNSDEDIHYQCSDDQITKRGSISSNNLIDRDLEWDDTSIQIKDKQQNNTNNCNNNKNSNKTANNTNLITSNEFV